jgi:hypothetical protein
MSFFDQKPRLLMVVLASVFLVAGAFRLYYIKAPGYSIDREYTSAIFARSFYYRGLQSVEQWQKDIANTTRQNQPILEPPITAYLVSVIYRVINRDTIWVSHLLTSAFWLVGGYFLNEIGKRVVSIDAAVFASAYYLFAPLGLHLSRSFQPEPLAIMLFLISLYWLIVYFERPSNFKIIAAGVISGVTVLYRPMYVFPIMGVFAFLIIHRSKSWKSYFEWKNIQFLILSLFPSLIYYGYGIFIAGYLRWWVGFGFLPHLYFHAEYWEGWLHLAVSAVGYLGLIGALFGLPMLQRGLPSAFVGGLWFGYLILGLVFNVHIHTHGYYHALLIPVVALSLGPIFDLMSGYLRQFLNKWYWGIPLATAILLVAIVNFRNYRDGISYRVFDIRPKAQEIGEIIQHSNKTVFVAYYYGLPLQYYGQFTGAIWPRKINYWLYQRPGDRELSVDERLNSIGFSPEYFVITNFLEFDQHHTDLKDFLQQRCKLISEKNENYLVYGDCKY